MKPLGGQTDGSQLTADDWNQIVGEIQTAITSTGEVLDVLKISQLATALSDYTAYGKWFDDTDSASNVYILIRGGSALLEPDISGAGKYKEGFRVNFRAVTANTGAVTLIVIPSTDLKPVVTEAGAALTGGEIPNNKDSIVRWDDAGDQWLLIGA